MRDSLFVAAVLKRMKKASNKKKRRKLPFKNAVFALTVLKVALFLLRNVVHVLKAKIKKFKS